MYEQFSSAIETIEKMQQIQPHPLLKRLAKLLAGSLEAWHGAYPDLKIGQRFLEQLAGCLYGPKQQMPEDKKPLRHAKDYREKHTAAEVKQKAEQLLAEFQNQHKAVSPLARSFVRHFNNTYDNWKANLFTCYDYGFIPNDNNALEASHNQLKRAIRRATGHKSSAKPLVAQGEQLIFCKPYFSQQPQQFLNALQQVDFNKVNRRRKKLLDKQRQRGRQIRIIYHTEKALGEALNEWIII